MKIKLKRTNNSFSLLRMKTIAGYGLLLTVLSIIVFCMAGTSENGNIEQNRTICQAEKEGNESDS